MCLSAPTASRIGGLFLSRNLRKDEVLADDLPPAADIEPPSADMDAETIRPGGNAVPTGWRIDMFKNNRQVSTPLTSTSGCRAGAVDYVYKGRQGQNAI